jgi:hypothetical protein
MTTQIIADTLAVELNTANPDTLADALRKVQLGSLLASVEYDTGTITASATVSIPAPGALLVQSARVVASGTIGSVGTYLVGDSAATPAVPGGGVSGVAKITADGLTITFPNTVTRAIVRYIPNPATLLSNSFNS